MHTRLSHPYNDCHYNFSSVDSHLVKRILNSGKEYFQDSCFSLCIRKKQSEICKCSIPVEYEIENLPSCRLKNFTNCIVQVQRNYI